MPAPITPTRLAPIAGIVFTSAIHRDLSSRRTPKGTRGCGHQRYRLFEELGEVPERSNGAVSKTVVPLAGDRGFESLPLRHTPISTHLQLFRFRRRSEQFSRQNIFPCI